MMSSYSIDFSLHYMLFQVVCLLLLTFSFLLFADSLLFYELNELGFLSINQLVLQNFLICFHNIQQIDYLIFYQQLKYNIQYEDF